MSIFVLSVFVLNVILFLNAKRISIFLNHGEENKKKILIFKIFNIVLFFTYGLDLLLKEHDSSLINIGYSFISLYLGFLAFEVLSYYNRMKFGSKRNTENQVFYEDNYNSRINNIILFIFIFSIVLVNILKIWGMESSLQQTGFIGIILAFLAFTSAHWLPGIISGLTLMNSNHIAKGDIIKFDDIIYNVFEIGFFYTTLFNVDKNTRVLIDNTSLSKKQITNLSKKTGLAGYRMSLEYNISYPSIDEIKEEKEYDSFINNFKSIFQEVMEEAEKNKDLKVETKHGYELFLINTGDYALTYRFTFYLEDLKNISSTKNVRKYLSTKYKINEMIQKKAHLRGISLATPDLVVEEQIVKEKSYIKP